MFILKSLHLENFESIDTLDLDFSSTQITAITGANGAGKSALINAIAFALTGYRKGESVKNYVKAGTEKAIIHLDAEFKGYPISYDIEIFNSSKHPQPTNKRIQYNGKTYLNSDCSQFTKDYELEELESLMFMMQGSNSIIEAKPAERASMLKKLFRFEFPDIVNALRVKQEEEKEQNIEYNAALTELNSLSFQKLQLMRETAPITIQNWEERLSKIEESLFKIGDTNESAIVNCEREIVSTQRNLNNLNSNIESNKLSLSKLDSQIKDIENFLNETDIDSIKEKCDKLKKEIAEHEQIQDDKWDRDTALNKELSVLNYKKKELDKQFEISKTGVCHACGQPIEKSHIEKLEDSIKKVEEEISLKKKEISDVQLDKNDAEGKELQKELQFNEDLVKKYNNESRTKETVLVRINDLSNLISERENNKAQFETSLELLIKKKETLSGLVDIIKEKNNLISEQKEIKEKLQTSRDNKIKNSERRIANQRMAEEESERDRRVSELNKKINDLSIESAKIKVELDIFENRYPNFIVLQACQKIEDIINSIVQKVFPYCRVSLKLSKNGVNFFYTSESSDEEWIPVSMASGAQRQILGLAYFVALAKLSGISCIFLDEIDAAMSAENASIIYDFIAGLDYFNQVFFISHRHEAHEAVKEKNDKLITYYVENGSYSEL